MKILFLNVYYGTFLDAHYKKNPDLESRSYDRQLRSLIDTKFGDGGIYSGAMRRLGWEAEDIITNCEPLQRRWTQDRGIPYSHEETMIAQIYEYAPDILYTQGTWLITQKVYDAIRPHVRLIVGQNASGINDYRTTHFDMIFTGFLAHVENFNRVGVEAHFIPLAFDPSCYIKHDIRDLPLTFVGSLTGAHERRRKVLEFIGAEFGIDVWGPQDDFPRGCRYRGEAWGQDMFNILARSEMTLNCHIDLGAPCVGNMRMFEATGCGALLMTDWGSNALSLFHDNEVVYYTDPAACVEAIRYYRQRPKLAREIARRGQRKTLKDHTYDIRMGVTKRIMEEKLR
ncbi:glycosyltransferase [Patescibacteria group bacterium]|nr:glycosyltransferase [Patescibacteria group bacterium]